jgi:hypothetical protein
VKINQLETSLRQKTKRNIKRKKEIPRKKRERGFFHLCSDESSNLGG